MIDRAMSPRAVVARESELIACWDSSPERSCSPFVLRGEPGIGKTLLWQIAVKDATSQGVKVLVHRAAEAEAGLADLVEQSTGGPGPRARQVDGPCVGGGESPANRRPSSSSTPTRARNAERQPRPVHRGACPHRHRAIGPSPVLRLRSCWGRPPRGNQLHRRGGSPSRAGCWRRWRTFAASVACPSPPTS
jgi:hypothetical protein